MAFTGASIWDGTGGEIIEDAVLLVRDGRVAEIGTGIPPAGSRTVQLDGRWIVPGFINSHGHVSGRWAQADIRDASQRVAGDLALYSHYGVAGVAASPLDDLAATRTIRHVYIGGSEVRRK